MNDTTTGSPVVLDVWCELQCPDCRTALDDLRALRAAYGGALDIRLRHFPLDKHRHSHPAAQAAEEAAAQGRGWEFAEAVLERAEELGRRGEALLAEVAGGLGLDAGEVETALVDGRHILAVDADQAEGRAIGVTGTPTYVIGGERLDGGRSQEGLRERIAALADGLLAGDGPAARPPAQAPPGPGPAGPEETPGAR
ncbi:DsbA family protein [Streptomyces zingiberis]|uniref:DsbA family protein n=1 Tax=Streptomyces zingiberis TaxID=2053010 RepID=A0ABX1C0V7_9ACTN|nr:DsbA family protein [Streptomyces zingiberis]NJQ01482.1 DsbA family protein [Streptomyces zingiberis]